MEALPEYSKVVEELREIFLSGITLPYEFRISQLQALKRLVTENDTFLQDAVYKDLCKPPKETELTEFTVLLGDLIEAIGDLREWMEFEVKPSDLINKGATCAVKYDPIGVTLIIGPWNYPVALTLQPLVGAIAAGCCAIVKPSEVAPHTAEAIGKLFPKYFDQRCYRWIQGGVPVATALLRERYDLVFYTGSTMVGKIVMEAAAKHLTPVVLELGGKSPCYIHDDSDMDVVAKRVSWGKFVNAGQTCIAPDYILCTEKVQDKFIASMKKSIKEFYGENPEESKDFARIVNNRHFKRVQKLIDPSKVVIGGKQDGEKNFIEPTVLANVDPGDPVMQEEIFGPVLPILTVKSVDDVVQFINAREKPLSLYVFTNDKNIVKKLLDRTSSGGVCVNDTVVHAGAPMLPFGGVGHSGTGSYHGKSSFVCFSHKKSCLIKKQNMEMLTSVRYPPYSENKMKAVNMFMVASRRKIPFLNVLRLTCIGLVAALVIKIFNIDSILMKKYSEWRG